MNPRGRFWNFRLPDSSRFSKGRYCASLLSNLKFPIRRVADPSSPWLPDVATEIEGRRNPTTPHQPFGHAQESLGCRIPSKCKGAHLRLGGDSRFDTVWYYLPAP